MEGAEQQPPGKFLASTEKSLFCPHMVLPALAIFANELTYVNAEKPEKHIKPIREKCNKVVVAMLIYV
jgi:hypothetical protein